MSKILLVSSCLAGVRCRYNNTDFKIKEIEELVLAGKAIPVCPELIGGLETPRPCCEIIALNGKQSVVSDSGEDLTSFFEDGAAKTLEIARILKVDIVILKSNSPSCGYGKIYDGTFQGKLIEGNGVAAELLSKNHIKIYNENNFREFYL